MDIGDLAKTMLAKKLGGNSDAVGAVMDQLLGSGDKVDLAGLVGQFQQNGLGEAAASWLGDGANASVSAEQVQSALGAAEVAQAADKLGMDQAALLNGLKDALPQLIDKSSSGGSLLGSMGGLGGLAKKFL